MATFLWLSPVIPDMDGPQVVDPYEALARALRALTPGQFDDRSLDGAKVNALVSIAWSLVGLLGDKLDVASLDGIVVRAPADPQFVVSR